MHEPTSNTGRPLISITPRKKSVRFKINTPSPRNLPVNKLQTHPLNVSYVIPSTTNGIDHVTADINLLNRNDHVEYLPMTRRTPLEVHGEKSELKAYEELQEFLKKKQENLRRNMTKITSTFSQASNQLTHLQNGKTSLIR